MDQHTYLSGWNLFTNVSIEILTMSLLQVHWVALFPYSIQRSVAKLVDSAQLKPWLKPDRNGDGELIK